MNNKRYTIEWNDSKDKKHVMTGLCEHKKDIVVNALNDAASNGKVWSHTIMVMKDK